ncbi:baseplate hub [Halorubrum tailed virus 28]|uniref:Baseplate hub n=1 Tax=Halorubrum tailed virus 28 TaxID=2878009 RepID=A0AAE8XZB1_9CAUD|nr:baseplate hub [Halorubrum tailed virus 28]UBF23475.1 baseplate hub [Halorubrum tailed virus 28]
MPDAYRVRDPDTDEVYANLTNATVEDAVNRFARTASASFVDRGSDLLDEFTDYTLVDIDLKPVGSNTWTRRFSGFVAEQDYDKSETSIDLLSHDHWLKRRKVDREFVNMDASDIVIELIEDFTPLTVASADVDFIDEPTDITERYKGVTPAEIIAGLTESSANEQFGATNDREFFLREFSAGEGPFDFTPGRYLNTEWEDDNRSQINQVRVKYGANGNEEVVVSDKAAQASLGESIGSNSGVILEQSKTYEGIPAGERSTARAKAEAILECGEPIAIGTIETFNVGALRPGQIVQVIDPDAGVDAEFRVADVQLDSTGTDTVLVAENREGVIDKLADLSEEQDRIEAREGALDPDNSVEFLTSMFDFEVDWNVRLLERQYLDRQLILGSERRDATDTPLFAPRGGALGFSFPVRTSETTTINAGETLTVASGETLETDQVELNGELALEGELALRDVRQIRPTDGGFMGDGFKTQTELVDTSTP